MRILFYSMALELCIDKNSCSLLLWRASRITLNLQKKKKFKISLALLKIQNNNKKYYFLKDAQYINFSTMREFASSLSCKSVNFRKIRSVQIRIFYFYFVCTRLFRKIYTVVKNVVQVLVLAESAVQLLNRQLYTQYSIASRPFSQEKIHIQYTVQ